MLEIWIALAAILVVTLIILSFVNKSKQKTDENGEENNGAQNRQPVRLDRNVPRRAQQQQRQRRGMHQAARRPNDDDEDEEEEEIDVFDYVNAPEGGKIGAKKMRKLEEKAERRRAREMELEEREERKKREERLEEERKRKEAKEEQAEKEKEEEERLKREEEERREHEEYLKLKAAFSVEEEGEASIATEAENEAALTRFIHFIESRKVVLMEDLASHFSLRTQEAVERVRDLMAMGRLSGFMDDRGKFIHVSEEEMRGVAKFLRLHGRVSISDLAAASATLLDLTPSADVVTLES